MGRGRAVSPLTYPPPPTFTILSHCAQGGVPPAVTQITASGLQRHGGGAPSLHFHSPTRRNSCCVSAARGECPMPLCCHSVTCCSFLQDRPTTTESLPHDAPGPALPSWHFSGELFYEFMSVTVQSPVHSPRHRTASRSSAIQQKHV
jgi:hypothetical protein